MSAMRLQSIATRKQTTASPAKITDEDGEDQEETVFGKVGIEGDSREALGERFGPANARAAGSVFGWSDGCLAH